MTTETMRELGQAAEELLKERGPKYNMSNHEAEEKLRELQKEESMEKVYVCSQYGSRGDKATNYQVQPHFDLNAAGVAKGMAGERVDQCKGEAGEEC